MSTELLKRFCEEGLEQLQALSANILSLEKDSTPVMFEEILRKLHSLKGSSRLLGLSGLGDILHLTEDFLSLLSRHPEQVESAYIDMLLHTVDTLQASLTALHNDAPLPAFDTIRIGLDELQRSLMDKLRMRLDKLAASAPEVFQVLNSQQKDTLLLHLGRYKHLLLLSLSFKREGFADEVRNLHEFMNARGLLISTTGTTAAPDEGFDLRLLFLLLTNDSAPELLRDLSAFAPEYTLLGSSDQAAPPVSIPSSPIAKQSRIAEEEPVSSGAPDFSYDQEFGRLQRWFIEEGEENLKRLYAEILTLERYPDPETINSIFRTFHNLKGSGGSYGFPYIGRIAHLLESFVQPFRSSIAGLAQSHISKMLFGVDILEKAFHESKEGRHDRLQSTEMLAELEQMLAKPESAEGRIPARATQSAGTTIRAPESLRVNVGKIDSLVNKAVELSIAHHAEHYLLSELSDVTELYQDLLQQWQGIREGIIRTLDAVPTDIAAQLEQTHASGSELKDKLHQLNRTIESNLSAWYSLSTTLGTEAVQLQLQPLSTLFELADRVVRDLGLTLKKGINMDIRGGEVEVDRRIIDELKDPFIHLLRNAVDHGIEDPAHRAAQHKPEAGTIRILARQTGFAVEVTISDDGRGIDRHKVLSSALERGLITSEDARTLSDEDTYRLLFHPGFSTSEAVTEISGRGVGLDVVMTNVRRFGGDVTVQSQPGQGTTFILRLPTTLTLARMLIIEVGNRLFTLPVGATESILLLPKSAIQSMYGKHVTLHDGALISVIDVEDVVGLPRSSRRIRNGLIIRKGTTFYCLSVPRVMDEMELMIKPLPPHVRGNNIVSGANILPDGRIALALNPATIPELEHRVEEPSQNGDSNRRRELLVVDDSLIARELLKNILTASGYEVHLARDGNEALQYLHMHTTDLLLTDIDMPVMDGVTLTRLVRSEKTLRDIPIVIITSNDKEEDRRRSEEAGANAYILKGSFNQYNLLTTIEKLLSPGGS